MKKNIIIRPLNVSDIELVQIFLKNNWRFDHPIANDKDLFLWQYRGFGPIKGYQQYQLAFDNEELVGIRAVIPKLFQIPTNSGSSNNVVCLASAMWMIDSGYRGIGLGYKMHNITENLCQVSLAIGANPKTSVPIFLKNGYFELKALRRYIISLDLSGYKQLLLNPSTDINIFGDIDFNKKSNIKPIIPNAKTLEEVWNTSSKGLFALHRNAEFWQWRYVDSPIFNYYFFGSKEKGFVVVRIEDVYKSSTEKFGELKILRIIEIIPAEPYEQCRSIKDDNMLLELLKNVLLWGKQQGCCASDFFSSSTMLEDLLLKAGFFFQEPDFSEPELSLGALFQPFVNKPHTYNLYLRIQSGLLSDKKFDFESSYFVRSDTDQDRPNMLLK